METKGLEYPAYDPRGSWGMALAFATADRGACHIPAWTLSFDRAPGSNPYDPIGKAKTVVERQNFTAAKYSAGICMFWRINLICCHVMNVYLNEVRFDGPSLSKLGERVVNLGRIFNVREGFRRKDDYLPERITKEGLEKGMASGQKIPNEAFNQMLSEYYELRGWDEDGIPKKETLRQLGVEEILINSY
jgi:aldehyde:ferredoxin oxidoreductase